MTNVQVHAPRLLPATLLALLWWAPAHGAPTMDDVVATIGDETVRRAEFEQAFSRTIRSRYYHGAPPPERLNAVRAEVTVTLVERKLLLAEAERRGIRPDETVIARSLEAYEARYRSAPQWSTEGAALKTALAQRLREDQLLARLEDTVKRVPTPTGAEVAAFYRDHPERFTEPAQWDVSLILLRVAPSAPAAAWQAAMAEAEALVNRIAAGTDFATLAQLHSADPTAANGGAMGYIHHGMLGPAAQTMLESLEPGEVAAPLRVLEGVVVLKLNAVRQPRRIALEDARDRALALCTRAKADRAWTQLKATLHASTEVTIHDPLWAAAGV